MGETVFFRLLDAEDKDAALAEEARLQSARSRGDSVHASRRAFDADAELFQQIPGAPFAYWVKDAVRALFARFEPIDNGERLVCSTNPLNDDFRYVRLWWEAGIGGRVEWTPWAKGGANSDYYYDIDTVIAWSKARETYFGFLGTKNRPLERPASVQHFFRPGLTWPRRTNGFSVRVLPRGSIFADKGPAIFVPGDAEKLLLALCGVVDSSTFKYLIRLQLARTELAQSFEVGLVQQTPLPFLSAQDVDVLSGCVRQMWRLVRGLDSCVETSHAFVLPALLQVVGGTLRHRIASWASQVLDASNRVQGIKAEVDEKVLGLYGIAAESIQTDAPSSSDVTQPDDVEDADVVSNPADSEWNAAALLSYAVGACFGRWDLRTEVVDGRPQLEPFDALPVCSPGMLQGDDGLPMAQAPAGYPLSIAASGLLVDDPGHPSDISAASRRVFDALFPQDTEARWVEAGELLGIAKGKPEEWLRKEFFAFHVQQYSRSRRKAPIYWQLANSSARYSVWLYLPRLTRDTFFNVLDVVKLKLLHEEGQLEVLRKDSGAQRKALDLQESFVEELRTFRDEVARVAPLWNPNLDDGVLINFAPLWRLVPQHRAWQKECKGCWEELAAGEYDWAYLAMHLWPERVVPKCREDRSLAIAHGLEDVFWFEDEDGKWKPRPEPTRSIESLVEERTSPAVKTARDNLLSAAAPVGVARRAPAARVRRGTND